MTPFLRSASTDAFLSDRSVLQLHAPISHPALPVQILPVCSTMLYAHPSPGETLVPLLRAHLPQSLPSYGCVSFHLSLANPPTTPFAFASFPPDAPPRSDSLWTVIVRQQPPSTPQVRVFSSVESVVEPSQEELVQGEAQLREMLKTYCLSVSDEEVWIGALAEVWIDRIGLAKDHIYGVWLAPEVGEDGEEEVEVPSGYTLRKADKRDIQTVRPFLCFFALGALSKRRCQLGLTSVVLLLLAGLRYVRSPASSGLHPIHPPLLLSSRNTRRYSPSLDLLALGLLPRRTLYPTGLPSKGSRARRRQGPAEGDAAGGGEAVVLYCGHEPSESGVLEAGVWMVEGLGLRVVPHSCRGSVNEI